jgi:hypothetical protein
VSLIGGGGDDDDSIIVSELIDAASIFDDWVFTKEK